MTLLLTAAEVQELTGKKTKSGQVKALRAMNVRHFVRPDGSAAVPRVAVEGSTQDKPRPVLPDFTTLHRQA